MRVQDLFESHISHEIHWVVSKYDQRHINNGTAVVLWLSIPEFDAMFKKDRDFYVGPGGTANAIKGRYERFDNWVRNGEPVEMPYVGLGWKGQMTFTDGRHRYSWMRDHGAQAMPFVVNGDDAEQVKELIGSSLKQTIVQV